MSTQCEYITQLHINDVRSYTCVNLSEIFDSNIILQMRHKILHPTKTAIAARVMSIGYYLLVCHLHPLLMVSQQGVGLQICMVSLLLLVDPYPLQDLPMLACLDKKKINMFTISKNGSLWQMGIKFLFLKTLTYTQSYRKGSKFYNVSYVSEILPW